MEKQGNSGFRVYMAAFALLVTGTILAPLGRVSEVVAMAAPACALLVLYVGRFTTRPGQVPGNGRPISKRLSMAVMSAGGMFFLMVAVGSYRFDMSELAEMSIQLQAVGLLLVLGMHLLAQYLSSLITKERVGFFGSESDENQENN